MSSGTDGVKERENRKHERIECEESVAVFWRDKEYKGTIKNRSQSGFYIEIDEDFFSGLKIDLGYYSEEVDKEYKYTARIVRKDKKGVGVEIRYEV